MPRLLLVGINYWPEQTGVAPYTTATAEHLADRGWRVAVVTGVPHYPSWRVLDGYRSAWRHRELQREVVVRRFRHYVPSRQSAVRRAVYEGTFVANAWWSSETERPDVVIGVVPSLGGGLLALEFARRHRVAYGVLFQDIMGQAAEQSGMPGGRRVGRVVRAVEGFVARRAARVGIVAGRFRPYLERLGVRGERIVDLPNWSHIPAPRSDVRRTRAALGWPEDAIVVLHAGNMGLKQGLEVAVDAARLAEREAPRVRVVLVGDGSQRSALEARAMGCRAVTFIDPQPPDQFSDVLAAADVLLVTERRSVIDMSLPSKLTSYFVAGRPVIASTPAEGAAAREVEQSGGGLVVPAEDPVALLAAIGRLADDPRLRARLGEAGRAYAGRALDASAALGRVEAFVASLAEERRP